MNFNRTKLKELKELIVLIIIAFTIKTCLIEIYVVPTGSMEKTILIGDMLFGNKFIYINYFRFFKIFRNFHNTVMNN